MVECDGASQPSRDRAPRRRQSRGVLPLSAGAVMMTAAVVTGAGVAFIVQVARRKASWPWRVVGASAGLAGVAVFLVHVVRDGGSIMPLMVFTVLVIASNAFAPRGVAPRGH